MTSLSVARLAFAEKSPIYLDPHNSRGSKLAPELETYGMHVHDPVTDPDTVRRKRGIGLEIQESLPQAQADILSVAHQAPLSQKAAGYSGKIQRGGGFIDGTRKFDPSTVAAAGMRLRRL
jgi:UDP-N-acetyl-D-galactosamine dehydrogenase